MRAAKEGFKYLILIVLCATLAVLNISAKSGGHAIVHTDRVVATAYNSLVGQTDDTPWITASGTRCREGVIASNFLPLGTKVLIDGYGGQVFTVEDRMNKRYDKRIDIWFRGRREALKFGIRKIKFHVIKIA